MKRHYWSLFITGVIFCVMGFMLYGHVLHGEFVSDDYPYIVENLAVRNCLDLPGIWRSFSTRFLVMVSFAVNYRLHQLDVFGYHLVNIIIHIMNALLVAGLVFFTFRMPALKDSPWVPRSGSVAFYAGLIFLCHPVQTQAVSFITQRATSMAVMFYLLSLVFYAQARIRGRFVFWFCSWSAMLLGVFSKEMIVTLPVTVLVYEVYFGRDLKRQLKRIMPYGMMAVLVLLAFWMDRPGSVLGLKAQLKSGGFDWRYLLTEINVLRTYLRLVLIPVNQIHHYTYTLSTSFWEPATLGSFALLVSIAVFAARVRRPAPLLSFCIFWFFITTAVEFWVVCFVKRGVLYEHWLYLPMVGFSIFISLGLHRLMPRVVIAKGILLLIVGLYCILTVLRNFVWQTEIGFWEDVVQKSSQTPLVYLGSGTAYQRQGRLDEAFMHYQWGLRLFAEQGKELKQNDRAYLSSIYNNLGIIYEHMGLREQAVRAYQNAYRYDVDNPSPYRNLANICLRTRKFRQALFLLNQESRITPNDPEIHYGFGLSFLGLNQKDKAIAALKRAEYLYRHYGDAGKVEKVRGILGRLSQQDNPRSGFARPVN